MVRPKTIAKFMLEKKRLTSKFLMLEKLHQLQIFL